MKEPPAPVVEVTNISQKFSELSSPVSLSHSLWLALLKSLFSFESHLQSQMAESQSRKAALPWQ